MRHFLLSIVSALLASSCSAAWHSAGNVDAVTIAGDTAATLRAGDQTLTVTVCADDVLHIRFGRSDAGTPDRSWAVVRGAWPGRHARFAESPAELRVSTPRVTLVVGMKPLRLTFLDPAGNVIARDDSSLGMCRDGNDVGAWMAMPEGEQYYGFGEKAGDIRKRNSAMTMWNSDIPAYGADTDPLYQSIPFFFAVRSGKAYGIFFDNPWRTWFDMGKESRSRYAFGAEGGEINYYFFPGPSAKEILSRFTAMVGRMPIPPRWSLGYQQCRWSYASESRVREIAGGFRSRRIPCDMIYLDIDYMDGYRIFTWNRSAFPDPKRLIGDLGAMGFTVAVIVDPGIKTDTSYAVFRSGLARDAFVRASGGGLWTGSVWPGTCAFPDFTSTTTREWWGSQFAGLVADGVRGFWNDMNEPSVFDAPGKTIGLDAVHGGDGSPLPHAAVHNVYGMEMVRGTYDGVRPLMHGQRPFVLTRASYAGGERYSAAWTGDNVSSWEHLAIAIPMCLGMGLSGQPFIGSDIGGFIGHPSGELFARWLELGAFTPLMRAHSVTGEINKEPWEFGDTITAMNRETINLRYRFLPYIYTAMQEASASGLPAMRAMLLEFPDDPRFAETADEFMFGSELLVAPVIVQGDVRKRVLLPRGAWYDFLSGERLEGGGSITVDAPLERIPLFARAGGVIPTQQVVQYTGEAPISPLTLTAFPPEPGTEYTSPYYEDDGTTFDYERGVYWRRTLRQSGDGETRTLALGPVSGTYEPPPRRVDVRFAAFGAPPHGVTLGGKDVPRTASLPADPAAVAWSYDTASRTVEVVFPDTRQAIDVVIRR